MRTCPPGVRTVSPEVIGRITGGQVHRFAADQSPYLMSTPVQFPCPVPLVYIQTFIHGLFQMVFEKFIPVYETKQQIIRFRMLV